MAAIVAAVLIAACSSTPTSAPTAPTTAPTVPTTSTSVVPTTAARATCPNPDGGSQNHCLGPLDPGTYTTDTFTPSLTYTVPAGWQNMEDLPGNFLLIPPGGDLAGVNANTGDFIGVYSSIVAPQHCIEAPDNSVATNVQAYVDWLQHQASLVTTAPHPIAIGGLTGMEVDVSLSTTDVCSDPGIAAAYSLVLLGTSPSSLTHVVVPGYSLRLDLLDHDGKILVIELADAPNGGSSFEDWWTAAAEITKTFTFAG